MRVRFGRGGKGQWRLLIGLKSWRGEWRWPALPKAPRILITLNRWL